MNGDPVANTLAETGTDDPESEELSAAQRAAGRDVNEGRIAPVGRQSYARADLAVPFRDQTPLRTCRVDGARPST